MSTTIIGFPRLGEFRELKFTTEKYFRNEITADELLAAAKDLRAKHWNIVKEKGITEIPSNDFSHYDNFLDAAFLFNVVPESVKNLDLTELEQYFALARGYQGEKGDVRALPMKKWFNTNYHYIVPKFEKTTAVKLAGHKIFDEYQEAKDLGLDTRPVVVGPFTFLQLSDFEDGVKAEDFVDSFIAAYQDVFAKLAELGATRIQLDEPALVKDLTADEKALFLNLYNKILADKKGLEVLIQTYFGDVRDVYNDLVNLPVDAIGLDFVEGKKTLELVKGGFPADKTLYAGIVNGKNIWRNNYAVSLGLVDALKQVTANVAVSTASSLLHVPFSTEGEDGLADDVRKHFAFAVQKLDELHEVAVLADASDDEKKASAELAANQALFDGTRVAADPAVAKRIASLTDADFVRQPARAERQKEQREALNLPLLPTTTIGSFPQTKEVRAERAKLRKGEITKAEYDEFMKNQIDACIKHQEEIGLDVLVHGEFERNDMVEYFGQNLNGFLFTTRGCSPTAHVASSLRSCGATYPAPTRSPWNGAPTRSPAPIM